MSIVRSTEIRCVREESSLWQQEVDVMRFKSMYNNVLIAKVMLIWRREERREMIA